jgi:hypothetical protein
MMPILCGFNLKRRSAWDRKDIRFNGLHPLHGDTMANQGQQQFSMHPFLLAN